MANALTADPPKTVAASSAGSITLVRHGEPAQSRKIRLSSAEYRRWWARYEELGIKPGQTAPEPLKARARNADVVLVSVRPRAVETALAICGEHKVFERHDLLVECPLPPPKLPDWLKLSPKIWGFLARVRWILSDNHGEVETHKQAEARAERAARHVMGLAEAGQDVMVVAHGYFNQRVGGALQRLGWRLTDDQGFRYWSARKFERR